jgi:hypothetical protein
MARLIRRKIPEVKPGRLIVAGPGDATEYASPPSSHPIYAMIGEIAMRWSFIEELLDHCIGMLADTGPEITACITAQMIGHTPRCLSIRALAHWRVLPDIEKEAARLQQTLFDASDLRNRAVHDRLLIETKEKTLFKMRRMSKKELDYRLKEFDEKEFSRAIQIIESRRIDCAKLSAMIHNQVCEFHT